MVVKRGEAVEPTTRVIPASGQRLPVIGLGTWQVQRLTWKEDLIDTLDKRVGAPPIALPSPQQWPGLSQEASEFRRVTATVEYLDHPRAYVYTGGSALRADVKTPGYFVFAPARTADGETVVVNAGYVPDQMHPWPPASRRLTGYLRWPEAPSWFVSVRSWPAAT